jgi:hypothetical protein
MSLTSGGDGYIWFDLATSLAMKGDRGHAREWYDKAVAWTTANLPNDPELQRLRREAAVALGIATELLPPGTR